MRIWVTGVGVVSPLARGATPTMDRLLAGHRAFGPVTVFEPLGSKVNIAAEVPGLHAGEVAPAGTEGGWSRTDAMAIHAVSEALEQAGVHPARGPVDLLLGGTTAGMLETEDVLAQLSRTPEAISPLQRMLSHPLSSTADHVRAQIGPFRRVRNVCSACSSGANAILLGAVWLRAGRSTCVVAGGTDGLCRLTYTGFGALSALDPGPCRPFDRRRAGLNLGEGAGFLVLELEETARARGALPIAELAGWAVGAESHHITNPESSGRTAARVMRAALRSAGLTPADLDYVNAHGTATPLNDAMETAALHQCLGDEATRIPVSSCKGQIGHTLAAAGGIEAAITALAIARGVMPPTIGLEEVDPACRLVHVTEAREGRIRAAMSNSFGFGGTDSVLVFSAVAGARRSVGLAPHAPPDPSLERGSVVAVAAPRPSTRRIVVTGAATVGPLGVQGVEGSGGYLEPGPPPADGALELTFADHLDLGRARRMDRAARLATIALERAVREAGLPLAGEAGCGVGAILGASFGSVDASTAYMRRIYDKGAKFASPADFPNLVPSSPVGHASIYLGLRGPVFALTDLGATAESSLVTAAELVSEGEAEAMLAGSVEEASVMIERCLGPLCSGISDRGMRGEGASALLFEAEETARARGATALARLAWWTSWRGDGRGELATLPAPPEVGAAIFVGRLGEAGAPLVGPWAGVPCHALAARAGDHEGAGGFAAAAAVSQLARGTLTAALVLGSAPDRGYALLLVAPSRGGGEEPPSPASDDASGR